MKMADFCFDEYSAEYCLLNIAEKPVYVFANHATAIRAWFRESRNAPVNLITFDEHTDTFPPLLRYQNVFLDRDEEKNIALLEEIKANISDDLLRRLVLVGDYLTRPYGKENDTYNLSLKLWNDEHITTSIYLGIIADAYICCQKSDRAVENVKNQKLRDLYKHIAYLDDAFRRERVSGPTPKMDSLEEAESYLRDHQRYNIFDSTIERLYEAGLDVSSPYILDIDLDYFRDINVLKAPYAMYRRFRELCRNAHCITIATEPDWVSDASGWHLSSVRNYNSKCMESDKIEHKGWDSHQVLSLLLKIIEHSLTN